MVLKNVKDLEELVEVSKFIQDHYDVAKYLKLSAKEMDDPKLAVFTIREKNELIAVTSFRKVTPHLANLERTIVHKEHRGKGIAKAIGAEMEKILKKNGFKKVCCEVYSSNVPMLIIKLKQGYVIEGFLRDHDEPGVHEYVLGKKL